MVVRIPTFPKLGKPASGTVTGIGGSSGDGNGTLQAGIVMFKTESHTLQVAEASRFPT
jgi:hypothetical protein